MVTTKKLEKFKTEFGEHVRKKRLAKGWSQEKLADLMGNNAQNISRLERGRINPSLFWCLHLAKAFDIKFCEFVADFEVKGKKER